MKWAAALVPSVCLMLIVPGTCRLAGGAEAAAGRATLYDRALTVTVDTAVPRVYEYARADRGRILGSLGRGAPSVVISRREDRKSLEVAWQDLAPVVETTAKSVVFHCTARMDSVVAATFDYAIRVSGDVVTIATEAIHEQPGYDLDTFRFPEDPLIRVTKETAGARAAFGNINGDPGRLFAAGAPVPEKSDFGLLCTNRAAAGLFCNTLTQPIHAKSEGDSTGLWCGDFRYSFKDENFEPFACRIAITGDVQGDGQVDWRDAACMIHDFIPQRVKLRTECLKYMADHGLDFEGFIQCTRQICNLSDGHPQLCLLAGWNGWGWDSEYPSCDFPGEEYGGREGLYKLHEGARANRCYVTMIHNFDDAYGDSQAFDPAVLCRNPGGELHRATWWSGGPSFIICPYKFYKTGAMQRTIDTLIAQGLERQVFSDVFTIVPHRESHDRGDPSDALTNIVLGKLKILDYLREHDIYMNSEGFNYEMLGRYIEGHNGFPQGLTGHDGIPLSLFITHGLLTKKFWRRGDEGRFVGADTEVENPWQLDDVYLYAMLNGCYAEKPMRDFQKVPDGFTARYGDDTEVAWDFRGGVRVSLGGRLIADGRSVLLPKAGRPDVFRAYTRTGDPMLYPRPANWKSLEELTVMKLTAEDPPKPVPNDGLVKFEGGHLLIALPKGRPHKLVYGKGKVEAETRFEPLPPKKLTYPLDEVLERSAPERPRWVLIATRKSNVMAGRAE